VKMNVSVKYVYLFTIIFLSVTGSENRQVSIIHVLITSQFISE
jgi:hypothetical protein